MSTTHFRLFKSQINLFLMKKLPIFLTTLLLGIGFAYGQISLPYEQGFENVGPTTTFTTNTLPNSVPGVPGWGYAGGGNRRLRFSAGTGFYHSGNHAWTVDASSYRRNTTNWLEAKIDLSNYTDATNLELEFYYMHHGEAFHGQDKIWIRGNDKVGWIEVYDWYANRANSGSWKHVKFDLDSALTANGMKPSSTFGFRVGQRGDRSATSTTRDDGLTIDDFKISQKMVGNNNGSISKISPFCANPSSIQVGLSNVGSDTIKSATINWWVDGVKQTPYSYTGQLAPSKVANVTLGTVTSSKDTLGLKFSVDRVNGVTDEDLTDSLVKDVYRKMSGRYTIGANKDFSSINLAFTALKSRGVCGPVEFMVDSGTYSGLHQVDITIDGASTTNTITFDGQDSSRTIITHNGSRGTVRTSPAWVSTLFLSRVEHLVFKNFKFQSTGTGQGSWAVHLHGNAKHITFQNCWFDARTGTRNAGGLIAANSSWNDNAGVSIQFTKVENSLFTGGNKSISLPGNQLGNVIVNNTCQDFFFAGIWMTAGDSCMVADNKITSIRNNTYGISLARYRRFKVLRNEIDVARIGIWIDEGSQNSVDTCYLVNNLVLADDDGIFFTNTSNVNVWHNTSVGKPGFISSASSNLDLRNNIFYGDNDFAFSCDRTAFSSLDYNLYYTTGNNVARFNYQNYSNLQTWQGAVNQFNALSQEALPNFTSQINLRLNTAVASPRGTYISAVPLDIDGDSRCQAAASMGADESGFLTPPVSAFFSGPDTAYARVVVDFINKYAKTEPIRHEWFVDGQSVAGASDFEHRFKTPGTYTVRVISSGCGSRDTFDSKIVIVNPTTTPTASFNSSTTIIDVNESVQFQNFTTGGADSFYWLVDSYWVTGNFGLRVKSHEFVAGTDSNSANTVIEFTSPGTYRVCLYAFNLNGKDSVCKPAFIKVRKNILMCDFFNEESDLEFGKLFDSGGKNGNYGTRQNCHFLLDPCAKSITLDFHDFELSAGASLRIYDGMDNTAPPLHNYDPAFANGLTGSANQPNFKKTIKGTSGELYFEFVSDRNLNRGFEISWQADTVTPSKPLVGFALPDTVCNNIPFVASNKTAGHDVSYRWYMDTSAVDWFSDPDYESLDAAHLYDSSAVYYVQLNAESCGLKDSVIKTIVVIDPKNAPNASFHVAHTAPSIGDTVELEDRSTASGRGCMDYREWIITPASYLYASGFDKHSMNPKVIFQNTGCYDISVVSGNATGKDTFTVNCAVRAISTCIPYVQSSLPDIGITRVSVGSIDNYSSVNTSGYENHLSKGLANLDMGATYTISMEHPSGYTTPLNRAVWIDYNGDGDFDDATEKILVSGPDALKKWSASYTIPTGKKLGYTRIRFGVNYDKLKLYGCGPSKYGEFEDYLVNIRQDMTAPIITIAGNQDTTLEQCSSWSDPGASAIDNVDGTVALSGTTSNVDMSAAGTYTIEYQAKDQAGNLAIARRTVRVIADSTKPVITLVGNQVEILEVFDTYAEQGYQVSDNCGQVDQSEVVVTGTVNTSELGDNVLTYSLTDDEGNTRVVTRTVQVVDTQSPSTALNGLDTVYVEVGNAYTELGVVVTDNYDNGLPHTIQGQVNVYVLGEYRLSYNSSDQSGNLANTVTRIVIVVDLTAPKLHLSNAEDTVIVEVYGKYTTEDFTAFDNYDDATSVKNSLTTSGTYFDRFGNGATTELGLFEALYTVTDQSGNSTSLRRVIEVVDLTAPVIDFGGPDVVVLLRWEDYDDASVTAADNYYKVDDLVINRTGTFNKDSEGTYVLKYCASDPSGNESCVERTIVVKESEITIGVNGPEISTHVYPNPSRGMVNLEMTLPSAQYVQVSLVDMLGQTVTGFEGMMSNTVRKSFDLTEFRSGAYVIIVKTDQKTFQHKVLVSY